MLGTTVTAIGDLTQEPRMSYDRDKVAVVVLSVQVPADPDRANHEPVRHWVKATGPLAQHAADALKPGDRIVVIGRLSNERFRRNDGDPTQTVLWLVATEIARSLTPPPAAPVRTARQRLTLVRPAQSAPQRQQAKPVLAPAA
ncbi:single-stranded DNA-binding protein [Dactylosporangium sp. NPDC051485]|uniref:single-stranded DNA-binding protein n=1 Tax=Dactylosporangium sp. NPDC051485 TaxID=3154846 RepID=UPI00342D08AD